MFKEKVETSLEGILKLGKLIILPKTINLLLTLTDSMFLMLLKYFQTETLLIFSSITSYHLIYNILRRRLMLNISSFFSESLVQINIPIVMLFQFFAYTY